MNTKEQTLNHGEGIAGRTTLAEDSKIKEHNEAFVDLKFTGFHQRTITVVLELETSHTQIGRGVMKTKHLSIEQTLFLLSMSTPAQ